MFRDNITTPFSGSAAGALFPHITGDSYGSDTTFLSTLRVLLHDKIADDERVRLTFARTTYGIAELHSDGAISRARNVYTKLYEECGNIIVHSISGSEDVWNENVSMFSKLLEEELKFTKVQKVSDFFKSSFGVACYINKESKNVVLMVNNNDIRKMHCLQAAIFAYMPWYFDPKECVSADVMDLVKSLCEKTPDRYVELINKFAEQFDFRSGEIRAKLAGFETSQQRFELARLREDIDGFEKSINDLYQRAARFIRDREDLMVKVLGLEEKIKSDESEDSEMMQYFIANKYLTLDDVDGSFVTFSVKAYLEYFDRDLAERTIDNKKSFVYGFCEEDEAEDTEFLMREIFLNDNAKVRIRFCAAYRIDIRGDVTALEEYPYGSEFDTYMRNPHIDRYQCLGNYRQEIQKLLAKHDYIGAIEECMASARSLNFGDSVVMGTFMNAFCNNHLRVFELSDGRVVTAPEAVEWLKSEE